MTRTTQALKRLGVAGLAVVTIGAGVPALLGTAAQAAPATGITVAPNDNGSAAAGTCEPYTITLSGVSTTDTSTVSVVLTDPSSLTTTSNPSAASAVFCQLNAAGDIIPASSSSDATTPATPAPSSSTSLSANKRQESFATSPGQTVLQFGVFDSEQEVVGIQAYVDTNGNGVYDASVTSLTGTPGEPSATTSATFTPGSAIQDSQSNVNVFDQAANDNVRRLTATQSAAQAASAVSGPGGQQVYTVTAYNATTGGDEVRGATVSYQINAGGANSSTTTTPTRGDCGVTNNSGQVVCSVPTTKAGTDTITFYVNQTNGGTGSTVGTAGPDPKEPQVTVTTNTSPAPQDARYVTLSPNGQTFTTGASGSSVAYTAKVTDVNGTPVRNVLVTFSVSGVGRLSSGNTDYTDGNGLASVVVTTAANETGTQTVTADITNQYNGSTAYTNQCGQPAGTPTGSTAGNCTATATNTISNASASATPTTTAPGCEVASIRINTVTINATGYGSVTVYGVRPGSSIQIQGYSQNHAGTMNFTNDPTQIDRGEGSPSGKITTGSDGTVTVSNFRLTSDTRLHAKVVGCAFGNSDVINVRAQQTLNVKRTGVRAYTFYGTSIPAREGGLIVNLYRIKADGTEVLVGQTRASSGVDGQTATYSLAMKFGSDYSSRENFVLKTGKDAQNAPGRSNVRSLAIF